MARKKWTTDPQGNARMKDMQAHLEGLRTDAAECRSVSDRATDPQKRELFGRLADHLAVLACDIERTIAATLSDGESDLFIVGSECHLLDATKRRLGHEPTE